MSRQIHKQGRDVEAHA